MLYLLSGAPATCDSKSIRHLHIHVLCNLHYDKLSHVKMKFSSSIFCLADQADQSRNFSFYNGFSNSTSDRTEIWRHTASTGSEFTKTFSQPVLLQYVEIASAAVLTICELKLFQSKYLSHDINVFQMRIKQLDIPSNTVADTNSISFPCNLRNLMYCAYYMNKVTYLNVLYRNLFDRNIKIRTLAFIN